jgi:hypothetical protein
MRRWPAWLLLLGSSVFAGAGVKALYIAHHDSDEGSAVSRVADRISPLISGALDDFKHRLPVMSSAKAWRDEQSHRTTIDIAPATFIPASAEQSVAEAKADEVEAQARSPAPASEAAATGPPDVPDEPPISVPAVPPVPSAAATTEPPALPSEAPTSAPDLPPIQSAAAPTEPRDPANEEPTFLRPTSPLVGPPVPTVAAPIELPDLPTGAPLSRPDISPVPIVATPAEARELPNEPPLPGALPSPSAVTAPVVERPPVVQLPVVQLPVVESSVVQPPEPHPPAVRMDPSEAARLRARGDELLGRRDIIAARLFFTRAAEGGDAASALALGKTFDPAFLRSMGAIGLSGDVSRAAFWYARARDLGNTEANLLLLRLTPG